MLVIESKRPTPNPPSQGYGAAGAQRPMFNSKALLSRVAVDDEGPRIRAVDHTFYFAESFLLSGVLHRLRGSG